VIVVENRVVHVRMKVTQENHIAADALAGGDKVFVQTTAVCFVILGPGCVQSAGRLPYIFFAVFDYSTV